MDRRRDGLRDRRIDGYNKTYKNANPQLKKTGTFTMNQGLQQQQKKNNNNQTTTKITSYVCYFLLRIKFNYHCWRLRDPDGNKFNDFFRLSSTKPYNVITMIIVRCFYIEIIIQFIHSLIHSFIHSFIHTSRCTLHTKRQYSRSNHSLEKKYND